MGVRSAMHPRSTPTTAPLTLNLESQQKSHDEETSIITLSDESEKRPRVSIIPRKKVSFSNSCRARLCMGLDEYSPQEKAACWFAKEEYSTIRQKSIRIVKHMIHGKAEGLCTRGLERMAPNAAAARDARKERAYDAVLDEQDLQHITKEINPERIAHLYREAGSKEAHLHAVQMGLLDSVMATKIHSL